MKKVLFVATVDSHILAFHIPYLKYFKENGYEVSVATNGDEDIPFCDKKFKLSIERSPIKIGNIKAIKKLKDIIEKEKFDLIHCHTPMGSVVTRLAAKKSRKQYGTRVIYTAHGFHFYKGAPIRNWIIYYPIEKHLSKYTDCLITINKEDYDIAKRKFKKVKDIQYVHGVGFNIERLKEEVREDYKEKLHLNKNDIILSYVAEINVNKNQTLLVNCIEKLRSQFPNIKLLLIGKDSNNGQVDKIIKQKGLEENVKLLGNREDIGKLLSITDIYVASSLREGLPVNIMEAMYKKLPIVAIDNRGHRELIKDGETGFIVKDENTMIKKVIELINNKELREKIGAEAFETSKEYKLDKVINEMKKIYESEQT